MPASTSRPSSLRSSTGMSGLLRAETGGAMVQLDPLGGGSGFREGYAIDPDAFSPVPDYPDSWKGHPTTETSDKPLSGSLTRHTTVLSKHPSSSELHAILSNPPRNILPSTASPSVAQMSPEHSRSRSRLELDLTLETNTFVEGDCLRGRLEVKVRKPGKKDGILLIGGAKLRVVGFEALSDDRHTFYQHAQPLEAVSSATHFLYSSETDDQGFREACVGTHIIPFALPLPVDGGAKGPLVGSSAASVRYIILASIKIRNAGIQSRSIAHFYRICSIYPVLQPAEVLAPAPRPLRTSSAKTLFLGGKGKVDLSCTLHRATWVAGQYCWIKINIQNDTSRRVKALSLTLIRTTTVFRSLPHLDPGAADETGSIDIDACQTSTNRKEVAETVLESGQKGYKGVVTGKGWWMGVNAGEYSDLKHSLLIPPDALSIRRSRLVEVDYVLRVTATAGSLSSEVSVDLPITIISFLSIDPPPSFDLISTFSPSATSNSTTEIVPPALPHLGEIHRTVASSLPKRRKAVSFSGAAIFKDADTGRPVLRTRQTQADLRGHIRDSAHLDQTPSRATYRPAIELASDFQPQLYRRKVGETEGGRPEYPAHALLLPAYPVTAPGHQRPANESFQRRGDGGLGYHSQAGDQYTLGSNGPYSAVASSSEEITEGRDTEEGLGEYYAHELDDNATLHQAAEYIGDSDNEVEYVIGSCQLDGDIGKNSIRFTDHLSKPDHFAHADRHEVHYRTRLSSPNREVLPPHSSVGNIPSASTRNQLRAKTRPLSHKTDADAQLDRSGPQLQYASVPKPLTHSLPPQQSDSLPEIYRTELNLARNQEQSETQRIRRNLALRPRVKSMLDLHSSVDPEEFTPNLTPRPSVYPTAGTHLESSGFSRSDSLSNTTILLSDGLTEHSSSFSPSTDRVAQLPYLQAPHHPVPEKGGIPSSSIGSTLAVASSASEMISPSVYSSSASSPNIASIPMSDIEASSLPKAGISSVKARIALLEEKNRAMGVSAAAPVAVADRSSSIINPKIPAHHSRDSSLYFNGQVPRPPIDGLPPVSGDDEKKSVHNRHSVGATLSRGNLSQVDLTMTMEARPMRDVDHSKDGKRNSGNMVGLGLVPLEDQKLRRRPLPDTHRE